MRIAGFFVLITFTHKKRHKYMLDRIASKIRGWLNIEFGHAVKLNPPIIPVNTENLKSLFEEIYKETVLPLFKKQGFKRKGQNFMRTINDVTQTVNLQKSRWNHVESLSFTFNIGVYNAEIQKVYSTIQKQIEFPNVTDSFFQDRLGTFSHKEDYWYELTPKTDKLAFINDLKYDLETFLFEMFNQHNSWRSMEFFVTEEENYNGFNLFPYRKIIFFMEIDQTDKAIKLLQQEYKESLIPKSSILTTNFPDNSQTKISEPSLNQRYINSLKELASHYSLDLEKSNL